jgi:hypothetical protein
VATRVDESASEAAAHDIEATIVHPDGTLEAITLAGDDAHRFALIREILGGAFTSIMIEDQDGSAALGWVRDGTPDGLLPNPLAAALSERPVRGPMVITGLGHADDETTTSIHQGLQRVLERMAVAHRAGVTN